MTAWNAGKVLTEGVDPSRDVWQSWQDLRGSSVQHWYPKDMKVVAFVFNKVTSSSHPTDFVCDEADEIREAVECFADVAARCSMLQMSSIALTLPGTYCVRGHPASPSYRDT